MAQESGILYDLSSGHELDAISFSLRRLEESAASDAYEFFDVTVARLVQKPVVYLEQMKDTAPLHADGKLLLPALLEQWRYYVRNKDVLLLKNIASWLSSYLAITLHLNSNQGVISNIVESVLDFAPAGDIKRYFSDMQHHQHVEEWDRVTYETVKANERFRNNGQAVPSNQSDVRDQEQVSIPDGPSLEKIDYPELQKWHREEVQDAVSGHVISDLCLCLCSQYKAVRLESLQALQAFKSKLKVSAH